METVQINDFVRLQISDVYGDYQIKEISDNHDILVSMIYPQENDKRVIIRYDSSDNQWKFIDIKVMQHLTFIKNEDYIHPKTLLDSPPDVVREIAIRLPVKYLLNLCLTNKQLNEHIFNNTVFWKMK